MPKSCKDQRGPICTALIDRDICANRKDRIECKAKAKTGGIITDEVYEEILAEISAQDLAALPRVPEISAQEELPIAPEIEVIHEVPEANPRARKKIFPKVIRPIREDDVKEEVPRAQALPKANSQQIYPQVRRRVVPEAAAAAAPVAAAQAEVAIDSPVREGCVVRLRKGLQDALKWGTNTVCYYTTSSSNDARRNEPKKIAINPINPANVKTRALAEATRKANAVGIDQNIVLKGSPIQNLEEGPHSAITATILRLVDDIDSIENIITLITNTEVKETLRQDIENMPRSDYKKNVIKVYELVTSKNFLKLFNHNSLIEFTPEDILLLKSSIKYSIEKDGVFVIYNEVLAMMNNKFEEDEILTSTTTVYLSNANSERSELLENYLWSDRASSIDSILDNFGEFTIVPKTSASPTIMFTAKFLPNSNSIKSLDIMQPSKVFFKVFPTGNMLGADGRPITKFGDTIKHNSTAVQFEKECFKALFSLQKYNVTPNILCNIASSNNSERFDTFITSPEVTRKFKQDAQTEIIKYYLDNDDYHNNYYKFPAEERLTFNTVSIIMTQLGGDPMNKVFFTLNARDRKCVMFQLLYNLYVFEQIQFSHGDLHMGNILVNTIPETILCYKVNGSFFKFRTTKLVKMFDFDHSTICKTTTISYNRGTENFTINQNLNPIRDSDAYFNNKYAETQIFNPKLDIVIFMSYLFNQVREHGYKIDSEDPGFNQFILSSVPGMTSNEKVINVIRREKRANEKNIAEFNRITGNTNISNEFYETSWKKYFNYISFDKKRFGRIIKSMDPNGVRNNHFWIPDSVVSSNLMMLTNDYFTSLKDPRPDLIDIRKQIIYTIDNRIV
jgi:hypothetical protein